MTRLELKKKLDEIYNLLENLEDTIRGLISDVQSAYEDISRLSDSLDELLEEEELENEGNG